MAGILTEGERLTKDHKLFRPKILANFPSMAAILFSALLCASVLLMNLTIQWKIMIIGATGFTALLAITKEPTRVLLAFLAFVMPLLVYKAFFRIDGLGLPVPSVGIQLYDLLIILLLVFFLVRLATDHKTKFRFFPATTLPALAWLIAGFLSLANAKDLQVSIIALISLAKLFVLYLVVANSIHDLRDVKWIIGGLLLALAFEALLGVYEGITETPVGLWFLGEGEEIIEQKFDYDDASRCAGTVCHPNGLSMYLNTTLPFAMALIFSSTRKLHKFLTAALIGVGVLALIFTLSRGGWIAFVITVGIVFVRANRSGRIRRRSAVLISCGILLCFLAILMTGPNLVTDRLTSGDSGSAKSRITMAKGALAIMYDYPVLGAGLNNYTLYIRNYDPAAFWDDQDLYVVHNVFLLIGAETGLLGLIAFCWFLVSVLLRSWKMAKEVGNDIAWIVGVGIFCGYAALGVHGMVDFALIGCPRLFAQFWFLAGVAAGVATWGRSWITPLRPIKGSQMSRELWATSGVN